MRHLPPRIAQALASLHLDVKLTEIGSNAFIALARIITFVDKDNPAKPIQVNRKTLAECIGVSIETTYRALRELDTGGWISRVKTSNRMGGSDSPMHLTEKTLNRLGLDKPLTNYLNNPSINAIDNIYNINNQVQKTTVMAMIPDAVSATSAMAPESVRTESTQSDKHLAATDLSPDASIPTDRKLDTVIYLQSSKDNPARAVSIQGVRVPEPLMLLVEDFKISPAGVCKLMSEATKQGHRLENVVNAVKDALLKLKLEGRRAYGYLSTCLQQKIDYTAVVRGRETEQKAIDKAQAHKKSLAALEGKSFIAPDGAKLTVRAGGHLLEVVKVGDIIPSIIKLTDRFLDSVKSGRVLPC